MALNNNDLFSRLREENRAVWSGYVDHPFVRQLADGSLPEACFRHYLKQDYLFLIHFARAYALATYKSETLFDIRQAAAGLSAIVDMEMQLHIDYCGRWGITAADLADEPEATETMAYTRYVLEKGLSGDLLDLHVALAPCIIGYAEIAAAIVSSPATQRDANPYREWIDMYAGEDYRDAADAERPAAQSVDDSTRWRGTLPKPCQDIWPGRPAGNRFLANGPRRR